MIPESVDDEADGMETTGGEDIDTWRALGKATDKKRADLLADVVGHPEGAIGVEELSYMNPRTSDDSTRRHLKTLVDVGVVEERGFEPGERERGYPYKFYSVTEEARRLFDRNGLFPVEP